MPRILIVDDEPEMVRGLEDNLRFEGYQTLSATDGRRGLALALSEAPDLVLLDIMMPGMSGWDVCRELRAKGLDIPVIMLTARGEEADRVQGLELGADDYVTKPFSPKALLARVKALLRRVERAKDEAPSRSSYGSLVLDRTRHEVKANGKEITLTAKEFGLLEFLLQNPGRVLTRDVLLNAVWGYEYYGTTRTIDVHVRRLKQKIPMLNDAITSIKSLGYKLKDRDE